MNKLFELEARVGKTDFKIVTQMIGLFLINAPEKPLSKSYVLKRVKCKYFFVKNRRLDDLFELARESSLESAYSENSKSFRLCHAISSSPQLGRLVDANSAYKLQSVYYWSRLFDFEKRRQIRRTSTPNFPVSSLVIRYIDEEDVEDEARNDFSNEKTVFVTSMTELKLRRIRSRLKYYLRKSCNESDINILEMCSHSVKENLNRSDLGGSKDLFLASSLLVESGKEQDFVDLNDQDLTFSFKTFASPSTSSNMSKISSRSENCSSSFRSSTTPELSNNSFSIGFIQKIRDKTHRNSSVMSNVNIFNEKTNTSNYASYTSSKFNLFKSKNCFFNFFSKFSRFCCCN